MRFDMLEQRVPSYNLNALGPTEFERLAQALLKEVIGVGTITFGPGPDGGREATYTGIALYPSAIESWSGSWIFQAKYHDLNQIGVNKARASVLSDLDSELNKITSKYNLACDNYIMITNVPLTGVHKSGNLDKIQDDIAPRYESKIRNIHVWGADDVSRLLERYPSVRTSFLHFIVAGDLIARLLRKEDDLEDETRKTIDAYLRTTFSREEPAQLDQAGDVSDDKVNLQQVFFDLAAGLDRSHLVLTNAMTERLHNVRSKSQPNDTFDVVRLMLQDVSRRVVLIGGPGEGKSTLGQYLAQLHRATLLRKIDEVALDLAYYPTLPRIPFRIILKDFGQWLARRLSDNSSGGTLDQYICDHIEAMTGRRLEVLTLHGILAKDPILLILDGLDEVTDPNLKSSLLKRASEFFDRCEKVHQANLQMMATTRPIGYTEQFDPRENLHLTLRKLTPDQVRSYVGKWVTAKAFDPAKCERILESVDECLADAQIRLLATTPLQVTILALIISSGGTPPRQREALFNEYLEVIYKRETAKGRHIIQSDKELLIGLHKFIGYILQEQATRAQDTASTLDVARYGKFVHQFLLFQDPYSAQEKRDAEHRAITREAGERLVLIVEPVSGKFGFELRSIQEFFAACHLVDTSRTTVQRYERFDALARLVHWRNVALFFAGRVGRNFPGEAGNVIEVCRDIDRSGPDRHIRRGSTLALELAADRAFGPNRRSQRDLLEHGLKVLDAHLSIGRLSRVMEILQKLPAEDIRDHIVPLLDERISAYAPDRLLNTAIVASSLGLRRQLLASLRQMIHASSPTTRQSCLSLALQSGVEVATQIPQLRDIAKSIAHDELIDALGGSLWETAFWLMSDLADAGEFDLDLSDVVARIAVGAPRIGNSGETDRLWLALDNCTDACVEKLALSHLFFLRYVSDAWRSTYYSGSDSRSTLISELDAKRADLFGPVVDGEIGCVAPGDQDKNVLVLLQWVVHIWIGNVTPVSLLNFLSFYSSVANDVHIRAIAGAFRAYAVNPVLDIAVAYAHARKVSDLQPLLSALANFSGLAGTRTWDETRRVFIEQLNEAIQEAMSGSSRHRGVSYTEYMRLAWSKASSELPDELAELLVWEVLQRDLLVPEMEANSLPGEASVLTFPRLVGLSRGIELHLRRSKREELLESFLTITRSARIDRGELVMAFLPAVLSVCPEISDYDLSRALRLVDGIRNDAVFWPLGFVNVMNGNAFGRLLACVSGGVDGSQSAATRILIGYCKEVETAYRAHGSGWRVAKGFRRPRFKGFADAHRDLFRSGCDSRRELGLAIYVVRPPVGQVDFDILSSSLRLASGTEVRAWLPWIVRQCIGEVELEERWIALLNELLDVQLREGTASILAEELAFLLSHADQSLSAVEGELGLPLALGTG